MAQFLDVQFYLDLQFYTIYSGSGTGALLVGLSIFAAFTSCCIASIFSLDYHRGGEHTDKDYLQKGNSE